MDFQLAEYFTCFQDICRTKFGRTYDFTKLERQCNPLRRGQRWLVAKDVSNIFAPNESPLAQYWGQPSAKEIDGPLAKLRIFLEPIPNKPEQLIRDLLSIFHNLGQISIILRFVHPARFAIFSAPVMNIVQVHRAGVIDLYLAYCEELAVWKEHFKMLTVADTEMALWSFAQLTKEIDISPRAEQARKLFEGDLWIQRRRAALVIRPFLRKNGPLGLAKILVEEDPKLAGKIASEEYERLFRCAYVKFLKCPFDPSKAYALIERLLQLKKVSLEDSTELQGIWKTRNRCVHPEDSPTAVEVERMIEQIERICCHW